VVTTCNTAPANSPKPDDVGKQVAGHLAERLGNDKFERLIAPIVRFDVDGGELSVKVRTEFHRGWLHRKLGRSELGEAFEAACGVPMESLRWIVAPGAFGEPEAPAATGAEADAGSGDAAESGADPAAHHGPEQPRHAPVTHQTPMLSRRRGAWRTGSSRFRLDEYIVGDSNRLAYNAALQMVRSEQAGMLFLHGACGVGKTHLLNGLAASFRDVRPGAEVRCVTGESFANEFIASVQANTLEAFRQRYRGVDLLCIDDVHFIAGKKKTMHELIHTFDILDLDGARLVLASDEHPKRIEKFSSKLTNRCVAGMVVEIKRPDRKLREELAQRLASRRGLTLDAEAVHAVASRCADSVREIEGAIVRIEAFVRLLGPSGGRREGHVTAGIVAQVLGESPTSKPRKPVRINLIAQTVCDELGVELSELYGQGRHRLVVLARSLTACLCRDLTTQSYPEIARALNRGNHSTVVTACQRTRRAIEKGDVRDAGAALGVMHLGELRERLEHEVVRRANDAERDGAGDER